MTYTQAVALYGGSPRALAVALGVDPSAVTKWKRRKHIPRDHAMTIMWLLAPARFEADHARLMACAAHRHHAALRYLHSHKPELLAHVPVHDMPPLPDDDAGRKLHNAIHELRSHAAHHRTNAEALRHRRNGDDT